MHAHAHDAALYLDDFYVNTRVFRPKAAHASIRQCCVPALVSLHAIGWATITNGAQFTHDFFFLPSIKKIRAPFVRVISLILKLGAQFTISGCLFTAMRGRNVNMGLATDEKTFSDGKTYRVKRRATRVRRRPDVRSLPRLSRRF